MYSRIPRLDTPRRFPILLVMPNLISRYTHWLHTQWPAGGVEKGPGVNADGTTNLKGVRVVGDLTGVPLLKFSADTGAKAVAGILAESDFKPLESFPRSFR